MVKGNGYNDILAMFEVWTPDSGDVDPDNPVYIDVLHFRDTFRMPKAAAIGDVLHLVEFYNRLTQKDTIMFVEYYVVTNETAFTDRLFFDDSFDIGYYHASREIDQHLSLGSYFTYFLIEHR